MCTISHRQERECETHTHTHSEKIKGDDVCEREANEVNERERNS